MTPKPFYAPEEPDPEFRETWAGGHAMIVQYGDCEFIASCQCGLHLVTLRPDEPTSVMFARWAAHTMHLPT